MNEAVDKELGNAVMGRPHGSRTSGSLVDTVLRLGVGEVTARTTLMPAGTSKQEAKEELKRLAGATRPSVRRVVAINGATYSYERCVTRGKGGRLCVVLLIIRES